jgi:hypothetical protein
MWTFFTKREGNQPFDQGNHLDDAGKPQERVSRYERSRKLIENNTGTKNKSRQSRHLIENTYG